MGPTLLLLVVIAATLAQGQRSSLNDFQRSKAMLLGDFVDNMKTVNDKLSVSVEECATRCNSIMDCRSFNYNWKTLACQMLPWTQHSTNMPLKRNVHYDLYQKKDYVRSCIIGIGENYRGTVSTTEKGKTCQHWGVSHPHDHRYFPNAKNGLEENYCRNPNKDAGGPWCYTTDYAVRHEFCGIKQCEEAVCYMCIGDDYRGFVDRTESGRECQRWDLQTPHKHPFHPDKYPDKNLNDNYCRNPDYSERPWCYTTDPSVQREYCKIQKCKKQGPQNVEITSSCFKGKGEGYRGRANLTSSGIPCQRWDSQSPQSHHFLPEKYGCKGLQENYCRNPDGSEAPWCFTTLPGMRVAFCFQIKRCVDEVPADGSVCYHGHGELYRGTVSMTRKGIACQKWSDQYPHVPSKIKHNNRRHPHPPAGGELALELRSKKNRKKEASRKKERRIRPSTNPEADLVENYCRNPDRDRHGPWCYTMDPNTQFDYCAIMPCTGDREPPSTVEAENVTFDSCGKRDDRIQRKARIVGGLPGNSPWTVSLRNRNGEHFCGGSLVQENWVISTRQCFSSCEADLSGYEVWLGTLFKNPGKDDPDRQAIGISTIMCGPTESHLVMLKLETPAVLNSRVAIICLPPARYIVPQDTECEIAGWGETKGTGHADVLKVAKFQVMNTHDCNIAHKGKVKDNEMCTKPMPIEVGACEGDYGGPLACLTHDCYVLEGVIIPGRGCGKRGQPAIFIRASLYVDWINKVMNMI